jgi:hypothetical protein
VVDPASNTYYRWLFVISAAVLYNLIIIVARSVFWKLQEKYHIAWFVLDYVCDAIYLMDMFVQLRTGTHIHRSFILLPFYSVGSNTDSKPKM